jgi:YesN/AraC family two-component response regulator
MYKILIADDEKWIRKGIVAKINYHKFQFLQISEAADGEQAMDLIQKERPHIVITDIRMPYVDGIELIKRVKEEQIEVKFIIISGYAEFAYAEQAINMGVSGYILKPIRDKNFVEIMQKVINDLDSRNNIKMIENRKEILERDNENFALEQKINQLLHTAKKETIKEDNIDNRELGIITENMNYILAIINIDASNYYQSTFQYDDLELVKFSIKNILNEINKRCTIMIFSNHKDRNQMFILFMDFEKNDVKIESNRFIMETYNKINGYLDISITIGVSDIQTRISNELYRHAKEAFDERLIHGNNNIYRFSSLNRNLDFTFPHSKIKLLQKCIERHDVKNIKIILNDIFSIENFKRAYAMHVRFVWLEVINMLIKIGGKLDFNSAEALELALVSEEIFEKFDHIDGLINYLYTTIIDVFKIGNYGEINSKDIITKAIQYIEQHYDEDLTVKKLAYKFAINPNYFSTLFKKEIGKTIIEYITDIRIQHACDLLRETEVSAAQIAQSIGYQDPQYFYRVFKKKVGKTPLEYRNEE